MLVNYVAQNEGIIGILAYPKISYKSVPINIAAFLFIGFTLSCLC